MKNLDKLYKVSEITNQFEKLQKKYQTHLPKVDPYLVYDLLLREQKNPATTYMYNIEVFTKRRLNTNAPKEYVTKKRTSSAQLLRYTLISHYFSFT